MKTLRNKIIGLVLLLVLVTTITNTPFAYSRTIANSNQQVSTDAGSRGGVCGNGIIEMGEECDDGGTAGGDGCSASCQVSNNSWICNGQPSVCTQVTLSFTTIASNLDRPVEVTNAGDSSNRLFLVEQPGLIKIYNGSSVLATPFLDVSDRITPFFDSEQGLLGLAFHPSYETNGKFYINYTNDVGATVVSEFLVSGNPNVANASSERILLTIPQPYTNHNGGKIEFGPDGYLYIAVGDGGSGGDPEGNGQNINTLLGKILRIDVNAGDAYAIPSSNPFVGIDGSDEIYAYGLRNPWKFSFDKLNGRMFIADVGQSAWEEVNIGQLGANYGWNVMEGSQCYDVGCTITGVLPVTEYPHGASDCSVTGGYVYRGSVYPKFVGKYFFGDYCSGKIWALFEVIPGVWADSLLQDTSHMITSFGQGEDGSLYIADFGGSRVRRVQEATTSSGVITVTPENTLESSGSTGGPFNPSSVQFTIKNTGTASLNWTASKTQNWIDLSSAGGALAANASTALTVTVNSAANSLGVGNYSDTITINNTTSSLGNTIRSVNLTVNVYNPACGNGILDQGEQCDDGNTHGNDGCSPTCEFEGGSWPGLKKFPKSTNQ